MILTDEGATLRLGARLAAVLRAGDVVALSGPLGAGKTTLARGLLAGLGCEDEVASPTFTLVQSYEGTSPLVLHVDLYRLENPRDADELGLDDALADHALLVEWPERLGADLWPHTLRLLLEPEADGARRLTACAPPAWEGRWPPPSR